MELLLLALVLCLIMAMISGVVFFLLVRQLRQYPREIPKEDLPLARATYRAAAPFFGVGAWGDFPLGMHRFEAHLYSGFFTVWRDAYICDGMVLARSEREIIATAVSVSNRCYFCATSHGNLVRMSNEGSVTGMLIARTPERITDPRLRALGQYGLSTKNPNADILLAPPFTPDELSDIAVVAFIFHYINRLMDSIGMRANIKAVLINNTTPGFILAKAMKLHETQIESGVGMRQLAAAGHLSPIEVSDADRATITRFTRQREPVANAFLYLWSTIQRVARTMYDEEVLALIRSHLAQWKGEVAPLSMDWLEEVVAPLARSPANQDIARQGVIIAREPFRISRREVWNVTGQHRGRQLALASFASFAATLRIMEWLPVPAKV